MFVISAKARRQMRYYSIDRDAVERAVRRPGRRYERQPTQFTAERIFEGKFYRMGKFHKKRRAEVQYEEQDRDTIVTAVRVEYL
jgi:hypothetical protein